MHFLRMDANVLKDKTDREMENRQTSQHIFQIFWSITVSAALCLSTMCAMSVIVLFSGACLEQNDSYPLMFRDALMPAQQYCLP